MQTPLQVAFHHIERSPEIEALVAERVAWLEQVFDRITGCRVVLEAPHRSHRQGNAYQVRIELALPGGEVFVRRESENGLNGLLREAFDAARRKVDEFVRRRRDG